MFLAKIQNRWSKTDKTKKWNKQPTIIVGDLQHSILSNRKSR